MDEDQIEIFTAIQSLQRHARMHEAVETACGAIRDLMQNYGRSLEGAIATGRHQLRQMKEQAAAEVGVLDPENVDLLEESSEIAAEQMRGALAEARSMIAWHLFGSDEILPDDDPRLVAAHEKADAEIAATRELRRQLGAEEE